MLKFFIFNHKIPPPISQLSTVAYLDSTFARVYIECFAFPFLKILRIKVIGNSSFPLEKK